MVVNTPELNETVDLTGHTTVIVGNIPSFASGANPFFKSDMADGYLEVVCVPNMLNFLLAIAVGNIPVIGYFLKKNLLKSRKVRSLTLELADDEYIQLDGEDLSGKVGNRVTIQFACQVHMLTLEE
jgi:diacylglycerol kinase family enzyme